MHYIYKEEYLKIFNYVDNAIQMYGRLNMIIDFCMVKLKEYEFEYKISPSIICYIQNLDNAIFTGSKTLQILIDELLRIQEAISSLKKNNTAQGLRKKYYKIYHLQRLLSYSIRQYASQLEESLIEDI